jgi:hypothetical protein
MTEELTNQFAPDLTDFGGLTDAVSLFAWLDARIVVLERQLP